MTPLFPLSVQGAETRRRGKVLVGPIDLEMQDERVTVVIGPNGAGKTSLLRLLHGTARLNAGQISWACDVAAARAGQAFVFQRPVMLRRTVGENLAYPLRIRGLSRKAARARALTWADRVGLAGMFDRPAPVLSGGEQQKLALARALICAPKLLFLDEPCAALDGRAMREIEEILRRARDEGTRLMVLAPVVRQRKGFHREVLEDLAKDGYVRARVNGEIIECLFNLTQICAITAHANAHLA